LGYSWFRLLGIAGLAGMLYAGESAAVPERITSVVRTDARTGRLVRSVVVKTKSLTGVAPLSAASEPRSAQLHDTVQRIAARHSLPPQLIHSVIKVESNYNPYAVSPKGALGLMQLIPSTARRFGVENVFNPAENIEGGAKYLRYLLDLYENDYTLALAAYNAGEGAVARYGTVPPYRETRDYVKSVAGELRKTPAPAAKPEEKELAKATLSGPHAIARIVDPDGTVRYVTRSN
jgi:hypothetical protein